VRIEQGGRRGCLWCEDKSVKGGMERQWSRTDSFKRIKKNLSRVDPSNDVISSKERCGTRSPPSVLQLEQWLSLRNM
jgi:hypothetical protein